MANLNRAAFDNPAVAGATNPSGPFFGYHHGPIPHPNANWVPPSRANLMPGQRPPQVSAAENGAAPNPGSTLSSVNGGICDIDTGGGIMCGTICGDQPSLRRHLRNAHPGAVANPTRHNTTIAENVAGQNALKLFVLSGGWRAAQYVREPGRGPPGGLIGTYADACERIAASDPGFATQFGTRFHRDESIQKPLRGMEPLSFHVGRLKRRRNLYSVPTGGSSQCPSVEHMLVSIDAPTEHMPPSLDTPVDAPAVTSVAPVATPVEHMLPSVDAPTEHMPASIDAPVEHTLPSVDVPVDTSVGTPVEHMLPLVDAPVEHIPPAVDVPVDAGSLQLPVAPATPGSGKRTRGPSPPPNPDDDAPNPTPTKRPRVARKRVAKPARQGTRRSARVNDTTGEV